MNRQRPARPTSAYQSRPVAASAKFLMWLPVIPLILLVFLSFSPVLENGFIDIDDEEAYLTNTNFGGPGWDQIVWGATTPWLGAYQPLGWWILEVEYTATGLNPWGYHFTSLLMQSCNAVVIYGLALMLLPRFLTNVDRSRIAVAAALSVAAFIAHPLRAEPVSWVSSQSYLPCAFLACLTIMAYLRSRDASGRMRWVWHTISLFCFLGSLGAKAVPLAMPFAMLALDVYPLRRFSDPATSRREIRTAILEKIPFFILGIAFGAAAVWARSTDEALASLASVGIATRFAHMCYSMTIYILRSVVPFGLYACYPLPATLSWTDPRLMISTIVILAFTLWIAKNYRRYPALAVAYFSFFVILLPNSGLIRNTTVLTSDRYTYMSTIPLFLGLACVLAIVTERLKRRSRPAWIPSVVICLLIGGLVGLSRDQTRTWHDSVTVWANAVAKGPQKDPYLLSRLGRAYIESKRYEEAESQLRMAVAIDPGFAMARCKLGLALLNLGHLDEAAGHLQAAIELAPRYAEARVNLGYILAQRSRLVEAELQFDQAAQAVSNIAKTHANLGAIRVQLRKYELAADAFRNQIRLEPNSAEAHANLGYALISLRRFEEAAREYSQAANLDPNDAGTHHNLGHCLAELSKYSEAEAQYREALRIDPKLDASRHGLSQLLAARAGRMTTTR